MFNHMTQHQRDCPPVSREVVVSLIGAVTTERGLGLRVEPDEGSLVTEREATEEQLANLDIDREKFHGEWNYTLNPRSPAAQLS